MQAKSSRLNGRALVLRLKTFIVSLSVMLAGLAGGKYVLFHYHLNRELEKHVLVECYIVARPLPRWDMQYALPSTLEAGVLIILAGLVAVRPRRASEARRRLLQQLLNENRFPDDVARQL